MRIVACIKCSFVLHLPSWVVFIAVFYSPILYIVFHTHFTLAEDYDSGAVVTWLPRVGYANWLRTIRFSSQIDRFYPTWNMYMFFTWSVFREHYELHHLMQIAMTLATAVITSRIIKDFFLCDASRNCACFMFAAIFLFSPNVPGVRLAPPEPLMMLLASVHYLCLTKILWTRAVQGRSLSGTQQIFLHVISWIAYTLMA